MNDARNEMPRVNDSGWLTGDQLEELSPQEWLNHPILLEIRDKSTGTLKLKLYTLITGIVIAPELAVTTSAPIFEGTNANLGFIKPDEEIRLTYSL